MSICIIVVPTAPELKHGGRGCSCWETAEVATMRDAGIDNRLVQTVHRKVPGCSFQTIRGDH